MDNSATETARQLNKAEIIAVSANQFGFYDKLCLATERVKVFNHLFNEKKPKFLKTEQEQLEARVIRDMANQSMRSPEINTS